MTVVPGHYDKGVEWDYQTANCIELLKRCCDIFEPEGMVMVLEFSSVRIAPLRPLYDAYSFRLLPLMGRLVANDADSYRYLAESIRMHPDQERLCELMTAAGLEDCNWDNLAGGIVAVHRGYVY